MTDINPTTPDDLPIDMDLGGRKDDNPNFGSFRFKDAEGSNSDSNVTVANAADTTQYKNVGTVAHGVEVSATPNWPNVHQTTVVLQNPEVTGHEMFTVPTAAIDGNINSLEFQHTGNCTGQYKINGAASWTQCTGVIIQ